MADEEDNNAETGAEDLAGAEAVGTVAGVDAATFPDLGAAATSVVGSPNLDMIRDIQVTLTVELGRTDMLIEEVLNLTPGQVIELDKLAGEPLDILVNDKLLAKGEVVVVDDNFGVRITSIVDPRSRVQAMGAPVGGDDADDGD